MELNALGTIIYTPTGEGEIQFFLYRINTNFIKSNGVYTYSTSHKSLVCFNLKRRLLFGVVLIHGLFSLILRWRSNIANRILCVLEINCHQLEICDRYTVSLLVVALIVQPLLLMFPTPLVHISMFAVPIGPLYVPNA